MTPERWRKIEPILHAALELDPGERAAYLVSVCGDDQGLRNEIEALIESYDEAEEFIETPIMGKLADRDDQSPTLIEKRLGPYLLKSEIGRGGMGAVYLAERADGEFRQQVAVKLIKRGMDTDFILKRFRHERQILADLNHPNIAHLLDGGTTEDGLPYFVMEYIEGTFVTHYCREKKLTVKDRLRLFLQICSAVAHAHQKKIIHRDIKPSNVLVTTGGIPKLLDFGIAKLLDPLSIHETNDPTTVGLRIMTPDYASPEQTRDETLTSASDQYSLGVLLYEMLTGSLPYDLKYKAPHEVTRIICEQLPRPPSILSENQYDAVNRRLLDEVVLKSLEKDPADRYASVEELAAAVEVLLTGRPVPETSSEAAAEARIGNRRDQEPNLQRNTVAVLPFQILSAPSSNTAENAEDEFLSIGLADALIVRLSKISRLVLCPTSSVLRFAGQKIDSFVVGRQLKADFVVEGTVRRIGNRVRVTAQLLSIAEGSATWAESLDERLTDVLELEDSMSTQIAEAVVPHLSSEERQKLVKHGTENAEAYEAYLRGRSIWHSYTEKGLEQAHQYFQKAVELSPDFAAAHSGIADFYIGIGIVSVIPSAEAFKVAKQAAARAIELDPDLAEAYASLAFCLWAYDWNSDESERYFRKCFEINDNYAQGHEWFAHVLASGGRFDEAIAQMHRALEIDAQSSQLNAITAFTYHNARRHREGAPFIERAVKLDPHNYIALQGFGWMYPPLDRAAEAIPYCQKAVEISNRAPICVWILAAVYAHLGKIPEAEKLLDELLKMRHEGLRYVSPYYLGMLNTALGKFDTAFKWLEKAIEERDYWAQWLPVEYRFDRLRGDTRFTKLLEYLEDRTTKSFPNAIKTDKNDENSLPPDPKTDPAGKAAQMEDNKSESDSEKRTAASFVAGWRIPLILAFSAAFLLLFWVGGGLAEVLRQSSLLFYRQTPNSRLRNLTNNVANDNFPHLSPDGGRIVFVSNRDNAAEIYTVNFDGSGVRRLTLNEDLEVAPAWTPAGRQILFESTDEDHLESDIWIMDAENGGNLKNLTNSPGYDTRAAVSPDGREIAFASNRAPSKITSGGRTFNLYLMNIDGTNLRRLTAHPFTETEPDWSPDGKKIAFTRTNEKGKPDIFVINADGSDPMNLTNTPDVAESLPAWSPDGKSIAYTSDQNLFRMRTDIWVMNSDGTNPRVLTDHKNLNVQPSWTPDGRAIVFDSSRDGNHEIYLIQAFEHR
jgi:Tol biopolymer transport system component/serine/threonine protein kinase/tetratricopeptide (TPR) repeat protein